MTACHIIAAADNRPIYGVTCFGGNLYVIRRPSKQKVQVYETIKFTEQAPVDVKDLGDDGDAWERGFTSCSQSSRLYISDFHKDTVYVVDVSQQPPEVSSWKVTNDGQKVDAAGPSGLSVNKAGNLIVTCYKIDAIRLYTPGGQLIKTMFSLTDPSKRMRLYHAVELTDDCLVVSRWDPPNLKGVCLFRKAVPADMYCEVSEPITQCESNVWLLGPRYLAVNRAKSLVFLADQYIQGIISIKFKKGKLQTGRIMPVSADNDLREPWCLYLDEGGSRPRLYVGERGNGRVFVFDNVDN